MRKSLSRRSAIKVGFTALGAAALPLPLRRAEQALAQDGEPHFFLNVCIGGAVDQTYWFDARPLEMTDAGII